MPKKKKRAMLRAFTAPGQNFQKRAHATKPQQRHAASSASQAEKIKNYRMQRASAAQCAPCSAKTVPCKMKQPPGIELGISGLTPRCTSSLSWRIFSYVMHP
jgi:hypothetical protein